MKKIITSLMIAIMAVLGMSTPALLMASPVEAANYDYISDVKDGQKTDLMASVKIVINVVLGIVALIAVVMIIVGGVTYTTSQGDSGKVTKAKDTILYGVIGLVVALLAFAIVNFVLTNVFEAGF